MISPFLLAFRRLLVVSFFLMLERRLYAQQVNITPLSLNTLSFTPTFFLGSNFNSIDVSTVDGAANVVGGPEPTTVVMIVVGLVLLVAFQASLRTR